MLQTDTQIESKTDNNRSRSGVEGWSSKIKHAIKLKTSPARFARTTVAQLLQPSLVFCFNYAANDGALDSAPSLAAS